MQDLCVSATAECQQPITAHLNWRLHYVTTSITPDLQQQQQDACCHSRQLQQDAKQRLQDTVFDTLRQRLDNCSILQQHCR
jgi:hypothetical protein